MAAGCGSVTVSNRDGGNDVIAAHCVDGQGEGCDLGTTPTRDSGSDVIGSRCLVGQVDLQLELPDGRVVEECLPFTAQLVTFSCRPERISASTAPAGDPPPRFERNRLDIGNRNRTEVTSGRRRVAWSVSYLRVGGDGCPPSLERCQYTTPVEATNNCVFETSVPTRWGDLMEVRLPEACSMTWFPTSTLNRPLDAGVAPGVSVRLRRLHFRGPLTHSHDELLPSHDAGSSSSWDCGT